MVKAFDLPLGRKTTDWRLKTLFFGTIYHENKLTANLIVQVIHVDPCDGGPFSGETD